VSAGLAVTAQATRPELRDGETIRAYLEELVRLQTPVRLWLAGAEDAAFETTLQKVSPITFTTTTTPPLEQGQVLGFSFMLDSRRFTTSGKVVSPGVFRIPLSITQGERRGSFRGAFDRAETARVFAVEQAAGSIVGGRTLLGRLVDLSPQGLRMALEEVGTLALSAPPLERGDVFQWLSIIDLPFTPPIHCRAIVAHVDPGTEEPLAGFRLERLSDRDRQHIERLLIPRYPATFGEVFPTRKRKTDFADQLGPPTSTQVKAKAPELVVDRTLVPAPRPAPERPQASAVMRLRKASRKLLFLSASAATAALAEGFRQDGFRHVAEARSYQEARVLAAQASFDLLLLDVRVGGHWARDLMRTLGSHDLLVGTPVILVADHLTDATAAQAQGVGALHVHERGRGFDELLAVVYRLLLEG
jgi:CheY-like chemotaxis protein